jgi:transcription antitermination factor NusG
MDVTEWIRQEELDLLAHIEDSIRSGEFEMSKKIIRVSDATFRAIAAQHGFVVTEPQVKQAASPFTVGDTVRIVGPMYTGQVGELKVIDPDNIDSCDFFCVYLDSVEKVVPFAADELERVENIDMDELPF